MSDPGNLSIQEAIRAALLSQAAYDKTPYPVSPEVTTFEMLDGMKMTPPVDVQCLIVRDPARITFAFRGTDDARKFLSDADVFFHDIGNGMKVHAGAWRLLDAIWPQLSWKICPGSSFSIYTTGHSLGGMLARLFTLRLAWERDIKVTRSITFGEPRSLNRAAAEFYNRLEIPTWRFVNASDIVTRVPWRFGLYQHVGRKCYIYPDGDIQFDNPWWYQVLPDLVHFVHLALHGHDALIQDHGMAQNYIDKLRDG